jgi:hypothetical protein
MKQITTRETGVFVLPIRVKQRKHESANVPSCDPVQSRGFSKHTTTTIVEKSSENTQIYKIPIL